MSDPSVRAMTDAEWVFEAEALRRKEQAENDMQLATFKANARVLRETLIGVLGLHIFAPKDAGGEADVAVDETPGDGAEAKVPSFMPAVFLFGNHHLLAKQIEQKQEEGFATDAMNDEAFEAFSQKLAQGDFSDLDPVHFGGGGDNYWNTTEGRAALARLGVVPREADAPSVPHFGKPAEAAESEFDFGDLEPGVFVED